MRLLQIGNRIQECLSCNFKVNYVLLARWLIDVVKELDSNRIHARSIKSYSLRHKEGRKKFFFIRLLHHHLVPLGIEVSALVYTCCNLISVQVFLLKESQGNIWIQSCLALSVLSHFVLICRKDTSNIKGYAQLTVFFRNFHAHSFVILKQEVAVNALLVGLVALEYAIFCAVLTIVFLPVCQDVSVTVFITAAIGIAWVRSQIALAFSEGIVWNDLCCLAAGITCCISNRIKFFEGLRAS